MSYKFLADVVVVIHFLWILFLIIGAFWGKKYKFIKFLHLGGLSFALLIQIFNWHCPLTHLEIWLRSKHHTSSSYEGSFIIYYLEKLIYLEISPWIILTLTVILFFTNIAIYIRK